ncbi:MAG: hypothetical protein ACOY45_00065 [Pseudomonadota bacterium]
MKNAANAAIAPNRVGAIPGARISVQPGYSGARVRPRRSMPMAFDAPAAQIFTVASTHPQRQPRHRDYRDHADDGICKNEAMNTEHAIRISSFPIAVMYIFQSVNQI